MRYVFILFICATLTACYYNEKTNEPKSIELFSHFPAQKNVSNKNWGPLLSDIKNHEVFFDNNLDDLITVGHEATHDVSIFFRMNKQDNYKALINAFYVFEDRVAIIENPPIKLSQMYDFIPDGLKDDLYDIYFPNPPYEDNPLYVWEEWTAYVNGAAIGVDLVNNHLLTKNRDTLSSMLEFLLYASALALAVKELEPFYYKNNKQFRRFFHWNFKRSIVVYNDAKKLAPFDNKMHKEYLKKIKTLPDAKKIRTFLVENFGKNWDHKIE